MAGREFAGDAGLAVLMGVGAKSSASSGTSSPYSGGTSGGSLGSSYNDK
ncbi:TPA: hypothetical protein G8O00_000575 [Salmonella enterica]|uniref:Uncharacterized protein n=1 Tax=Salmonella enterica TaxID=28901 RepID=A0A747XFV8_SALER|nr:hypothetical protein [Salmonella enterica subsp. enterica]HAF4697240.1 hypothetical protein [Salmonella enterica]